MNPKRWHQVEQIYNSVLERNPEERDAYLEKACAGDEALRKEVESLLACKDEAEAFIESPAMEAAAKALAEDSEHRTNLVGRSLAFSRFTLGLASETRKGGSNPLESSDGKMLFYVKPKDEENNELWEVPVDGGDETRILEKVYHDNFDVNRQGVYYVSKAAQNETAFLFLFYDFTLRKTKRICTTRIPVEWGFTVSPDERWILFTQGTIQRSDLMLAENFR